MAREWIVPTGKTQADIDAQRVAADRKAAVSDAREFLQTSDHEVIKAAEALLGSQGLLDAQLVADREAARATINDKEQAR